MTKKSFQGFFLPSKENCSKKKKEKRKNESFLINHIMSCRLPHTSEKTKQLFRSNLQNSCCEIQNGFYEYIRDGILSYSKVEGLHFKI